MSATMTPTRTGLLGWIARRIEAVSVGWTLAWLDEDTDRLDAELCALPQRLAQMRADAEVLRVRLALLND